MKTFQYRDNSPLIQLLIAIFIGFSVNLDAQEFGTTSRLSINPLGVGGNAASGPAHFSPNGNLVVFQSAATNLVAGDSNNSTDIFVRNLKSGELRRISVGVGGLESDGDSVRPRISAQAPNGFAVAVFESEATNLIRFAGSPDNNNSKDIFFAILRNNFLLERISIGLDGSSANGPSRDASVAIVPEPNRILVSYTSNASNLVSSDLNGKSDIFLTTLSRSEDDGRTSPIDGLSTIRISNSITSGEESDGDSSQSEISGNGRFIVFQSDATNLISPKLEATFTQIYLYDVTKGTTTLISKSADGTPGNSNSKNPSVSFNGNYIAYLTNATNIVGDNFTPSEDTLQIIRYEVKTGRSVRVNTASDGTPGNGTSAALQSAFISPNGRFAIFSDQASNLVSGDTNGFSDIFIKDLVVGDTFLASSGIGGTISDGTSLTPSLAAQSYTSQTASYVYASQATNLVENDTEGRVDVFTSTVTLPPPPLTSETLLEVPPDATLTNDDISLSLEKFTLNSSSTKSAKLRTSQARNTKRTTIKYFAQLLQENSNGKRKEVKRKLSKRNTLTFKNLKPGTYSVRYQVRKIRNDKTISKTPFSPEERFTVTE